MRETVSCDAALELGRDDARELHLRAAVWCRAQVLVEDTAA
jgi:hypothetical protein